MDNLRKQLEDLQLVLYNKDSEIQQLKETAAHTPQHNGHTEGAAEVKTVCASLNAKVFVICCCIFLLIEIMVFSTSLNVKVFAICCILV